ncbi:chemotaxis protein CheW [Pacificispira sp.]|uniref:chemotaxis protein CheW n=1 Tax=Pacificispira sp. TaxID=2888761 RepID=UPI003BACFE90
MSDLAIAGISSLTAGDEEQLVTMTVDNQLFGIPILRVQDIVEPVQITPIPLASSAVAGVLNLRGRIVTVIDLRVCLGAEPKDLDDRPMSVTVEHKGDLYTILVDSIGDVRSLPRRDLDKPPQTLDQRMRKLCSGVFRLQDDLLAVLDVERVLDPTTIAEAPKRRPLKRHKTAKKTGPGAAPRKADKKPASNDDAEPGQGKKSKAAAAPKAEAAKKPAAGQPSLFEKLGGELGIDAVVDMLIAKLEADSRLSPFLQGADSATQAKHAKAYLTQTFGGPSNYKGPDLSKLHRHLVQEMEMDDGHLIAVAGYLADCLNQMGVPAELIDDVMAAIEEIRDGVMGR